MWDEEDGFFYDVLRLPDGSATRLKVRSMVGLLPLCAITVVEPWQRERVPELMRRTICESSSADAGAAAQHPPDRPGPLGVGERGIMALVNRDRLRRILSRMLDENEFLSPYGIRALSRYHAEHPYVLLRGGQEYRVDYLPAESDTGMFGGNSNWRGPIWMPVNVLLIRGAAAVLSLLRRRLQDRVPHRLGQHDEPLRGGRRDRRPSDRHLPARRDGPAARSTAAPRNSRPIRTGATTSCSTSTSMATTARASAPAIRPAGPALVGRNDRAFGRLDRRSSWRAASPSLLAGRKEAKPTGDSRTSRVPKSRTPT